MTADASSKPPRATNRTAKPAKPPRYFTDPDNGNRVYVLKRETKTLLVMECGARFSRKPNVRGARFTGQLTELPDTAEGAHLLLLQTTRTAAYKCRRVICTFDAMPVPALLSDAFVASATSKELQRTKAVVDAVMTAHLHAAREIRSILTAYASTIK